MEMYRIKVTFVDKDGDNHDFQVAEGDNLLDIAQANDLEMEGMQLRVLGGTLIAYDRFRRMRRLLCLLNMPCHR